MDKLNTTQAENTLRAAGYEPDKPVSCLAVKQLYLLIKFAVGRTINHEETVTSKTVAKWSEDDESILQCICDEILANKHDAKEYEWKTYDEFLNWLKSLKDRVQPKQEWCEEDEKIRENCIHFLKLQKIHHAATFEIDECIIWLNNLK